MSDEWTEAQRAWRRKLMAQLRGEADAAAGFYRPQRKNLMTCMVIVHDNYGGAHLADCSEFHDVTESLFAWSSAVPCWQANWVPEFSDEDNKLLWALGVRIENQDWVSIPELEAREHS